MPTYEYRCKSCGEHIEVVQSFADDPLDTCPNCGGVLKKVFGNVGISFKGSGFYKTDSRGGSSRSSSSSSTSSTSSSDSGSTSTTSSESSTTSPTSDNSSSSTSTATKTAD